jgi:threonine dehydratase
MTRTIDRSSIERAHEVIAPRLRETPVIEVAGGDFGLGDCRLCFKLEHLQYTGSFKVRGAFANLSLRDIPSAGVVAASGGNHGVAVAYAARALGIPATIFLPRVAAPAKVQKIRECGAELVIVSDRYADALLASEAHAAHTGALQVHAYDQVETVLGQGTVGLELERQAPEIDTLLVAVGGGGLIAGIGSWYEGSIDVIGVEPDAAPTLTAARRAGRPVDAEAGGIAADSLAPKRVGEITFPIAERYVRDVLLVTDDAIRGAQQALWATLRIVVEPGGAAAFAALLSARLRPRAGQRIGILLCGANTNAVDFSPASPSPA